jgi:sec-independent protein translocase protein TatB
MEILGIGASELAFIILIAIIILGPKDMQKAGRTMGRWLNQLVRSDSWRVFQKTSTELRNLPRSLMRDANMELQEMDKEIRQTIDPRSSQSRSSSAASQKPPVEPGSAPPPSNEAEVNLQDKSPNIEPTKDDSDENG